MLLAIDSGNTNTKFGLFDGQRLLTVWRAARDSSRTPEDYTAWLGQMCAQAGLELAAIDAAVIASVVPGTTDALEKLCRQFLHAEPVIMDRPGVALPMEVLVDRPDHVGADRLAAAVGALHKYGAPILVVDIGSAATLDVVDSEGRYLGGVIAPGPDRLIEALVSATALLPRIKVERPATVIGKTTAAAMGSGIFWGYVGLLEGLVARLRTEYGAQLPVVATGGQASLFAGATDVVARIDADLTLVGLRYVYEANRVPAGAEASR